VTPVSRIQFIPSSVDRVSLSLIESLIELDTDSPASFFSFRANSIFRLPPPPPASLKPPRITFAVAMPSLRASRSLAFPLRLQPFKDKSLTVIGDAYLSLVCFITWMSVMGKTSGDEITWTSNKSSRRDMSETPGKFSFPRPYRGIPRSVVIRMREKSNRAN